MDADRNIKMEGSDHDEEGSPPMPVLVPEGSQPPEAMEDSDAPEPQPSTSRLELSVVLPQETKTFPMMLYGMQNSMRMAINIDSLEETFKLLNALEKYCSAVDERYVHGHPNCSLDVSLDQALRWPVSICQRTPMLNYKCWMMTEENLKPTWCRLVSHYLEWTNGIPDFRFLSEKDKNHLITIQVCRIVCLTFAYATYEVKETGIVFGNGVYYDPKNEGTDPVLNAYLRDLSHVIDKIIKKFDKSKTNFDEFLLFKLVAMFQVSADDTISESGREFIYSIHNKYRSMLMEYSCKRFPNLSQRKQIDRATVIFSILPDLPILSEVDNEHLRRMAMNNHGNLQGELTTSVHITTRKY